MERGAEGEGDICDATGEGVHPKMTGDLPERRRGWRGRRDRGRTAEERRRG